MNTIIRGFVAAAALCGLTGCAVRPPALWGEKGSPMTTRAFSASSIDRLKLRGGSANVRVRAGNDDSVRVIVELRSTNARRLREVCIPGSRFEHSVEGRTLTVRAAQPGRDRCGERWDFTVPARMAVEFELAYGDLDVQGVTGLTAKMANGGVKAALAGGPAHVELNVGNIQFSSRQRDYREIETRTRVGKVELSVNGYRIRGEGKPGSGDEASASGKGSETVFLQTGVGRVRAAIGADSVGSVD